MPPSDATAPKAVMTAAGMRRGVVDHLPLVVFAFPFGFAFGAAAIEKGMAAWAAILMSATVFAGASQFAVLDLWREPLPILAIVLTTLAVNARHIILGAAMSPMLGALSPLKRYGAMFVNSDANFAKTLEAASRGERDFGYFVGGGLTLWTCWLVSTVLGVAVGTALGDLGRFGLDLVMLSFFAATAIGLWQGKADLWPWLAAGAVSVAGSFLLPAGWHIIAGALAGGLIGAWRHGR